MGLYYGTLLVAATLFPVALFTDNMLSRMFLVIRENNSKLELMMGVDR